MGVMTARTVGGGAIVLQQLLPARAPAGGDLLSGGEHGRGMGLEGRAWDSFFEGGRETKVVKISIAILHEAGIADTGRQGSKPCRWPRSNKLQKTGAR